MSTVEAHTKTKQLVPELRFPEFDDEWKKKKLGDILQITSAARVHKEEWTEQGVPFFRTSDVVSHFKGVKNTKAYISQELYESLSEKVGRVKKDDLLVTGGGSIGIPYLIKNNDPLYFKDADLLWIKTTDEISGYFLYSYFLTLIFRKYIKSISHVGTIAHYTVVQAKNTPCKFPSLPEQQKIASFLSAVDEKIQQLSRKKALLEQYKKGVMQQIFSQQIRFKDDNGNPYPDWEEKRLGDIGTTFNGLTGKTKEDFGEGKLYVTYKQIFDNSRIDPNKFDFVKLEPNENQSKAQFGDVFFTTSSETRLEVGFSSVLLDEIEELYLNSFCFGYRINSFEVLKPSYARYLFRSPGFRKEITKLGQGSTRFNMSKNEMKKILVSLPCIEEQDQVANFIDQLQNEISSIDQALTRTQEFKKGLLQKMFV